MSESRRRSGGSFCRSVAAWGRLADFTRRITRAAIERFICPSFSLFSRPSTQSTLPQLSRQNERQIRFQQGAQGAAFPALPDQRAQQCRPVCPPAILLATIHSIDIHLAGKTPRETSTNMPNLLRSFLNRAYPTMKHHNPHTPIMIREALNTQPRVFARYEFGREKVEELSGELEW